MRVCGWMMNLGMFLTTKDRSHEDHETRIYTFSCASSLRTYVVTASVGRYNPANEGDPRLRLAGGHTVRAGAHAGVRGRLRQEARATGCAQPIPGIHSTRGALLCER